jgi:hypothetical protein
MDLNQKQREKLANLFMNISQALFISALIGPVVTSTISVIQSIQAIAVGLLSLYMSIKLLEE